MLNQDQEILVLKLLYGLAEGEHVSFDGRTQSVGARGRRRIMPRISNRPKVVGECDIRFW